MKFLSAIMLSLLCQTAFAFEAGYTVESRIIKLPDYDLNIVIIDGALNKGVADETIAALKKSDSKQIYLELNSRGGYFTEADKLYAAITELKKDGYQIDTFVPSGSVCASACTIIYLAGDRRVAGEAASFMVHAVQREGLPGFVNSLMTKHVLELYKERGVSAEWINQLRLKGVFSMVNDFWFSGRDAASKEIGLATHMTSGLIENDPPAIDPQIGPR